MDKNSLKKDSFYPEVELQYDHAGKEFIYRLKRLLDNQSAEQVGRRILFKDNSTGNIYSISVIYKDTSDPDFTKILCDIRIDIYRLEEIGKSMKKNFVISIIRKNGATAAYKSFDLNSLDLLNEKDFNKILNEGFLFILNELGKIIEKFEQDRDKELMS